MKKIFSVSGLKKRIEKDNFLEAFSESVYLFLLFIIPIYFSVFFPTNNVFELSKLFIFKTLVLLLLFINILWLLSRGSFDKIKVIFISKKFLLWPAIFFFGMGLSLLFSDNLTQSFFGSYDRQAGYLSYLYYFLFFILLFLNLAIPFLRKEKEKAFLKIKRLLLVLVFSGLAVSVYGILQRLGIDFLSWPEDPLITKRVFSSLGQVNFLASWLLFIIPISFYLAWEEKNNLKKFLFLLAAVLQVICLILTASRGGLLSFVLLFLVFSFWFIQRSQRTIQKKVLLSLVVLITIFSSAFFLEKAFPGRLNSLLNWQGGSLAARVDFYQVAFEAWKQKPIFGYGLENGGDIFIASYQTDWGVHSNIGVSNDRAHNLFLDIVLNGGLFLLLIFLSFYIYLIRLFFYGLKKSKAEKESNFSFLLLALAFGIGAYLFSLLFNFSFASGEIYFFAFIAVLSAVCLRYGMEDEEKKEEKVLIKKGLAVPVAIIVSLGLFLLFSYELSVFKADNYFWKINYYLKEENYLPAIELFLKIEEMNINPLNKHHYESLMAESISEHYLGGDLKEKDILIETFLKFSLAKFLPDKFNDLVVAGKIEAVLENEESARALWQKAIDISPFWPRNYMEIARSFRRSGLWEEALIYNNLSLNLLPSIDNPYLNKEHKRVLELYRQSIFKEMGLIHFSLKDYFQAEDYFRKAYQANVAETTLLKNIADTYYLRSDISKALFFVLHGANRNPGDYTWFLGASLLFKEQGEEEKAAEYLNRAQKLFPENLIWQY